MPQTEEIDWTEMAPSDPEWHKLYARTMQQIFTQLSDLQNHPASRDAEDLGDYVETLCSLVTFRPQTHPVVESAVREALSRE